ncbi:hypothetical protein [Bacillus sp. S/N-304-OC-R1]|uniref:hypothetical protein n=1 Tax=Bacillus sp. S/N-304-OC-R1 TaxID=2758034 RepID=UPI001C8D5C52|nr:hypothetical protein [Bacillus sp. S/N-304-OC-R1]MBY0121993.1 hypothetical protein [Bacillus sp. S/N-304-OC-R1]
MKKIQLVFYIVLLILTGCQQESSVKSNQLGDHAGFAEPEPSDWMSYSKIVTEYMYYRTQAVIKNNINILWDQYPELRKGSDPTQGINAEKYEVETLNNGFDFIDANFVIESYERMKVKNINDHESIVLVHGSMSFLRKDFEESGGEYLIELYVKKQTNRWTIVKTDEYTLPEYKEWLKKKG